MLLKQCVGNELQVPLVLDELELMVKLAKTKGLVVNYLASNSIRLLRESTREVVADNIQSYSECIDAMNSYINHDL